MQEKFGKGGQKSKTAFAAQNLCSGCCTDLLISEEYGWEIIGYILSEDIQDRIVLDETE